MSRKILLLLISLLVSAAALAQAGPSPVAPTPGAKGEIVLPASLNGQSGKSLGAGLDSCGGPKSPFKTTRLEGRGPNCAAALDNLSNLTDDQVEANCALGSDGVCSEGGVIVTSACAYNPSERGYSVTGYRYYTCWFGGYP